MKFLHRHFLMLVAAALAWAAPAWTQATGTIVVTVVDDDSGQAIRNLRRDPNCTVLAVTDDWRQWAAIEGQAKLFDYSNMDAEEARVMLRKVYMACSHTEHPDWDEYDQAMIDQDAVIVLVEPERVYGLLR